VVAQSFPPGFVATPEPGDFILTHGTAAVNRGIRFGQKLRFRGERREYAFWNHAALVVYGGNVIEALTHGVTMNKLSKYSDVEYTVVHIEASAEDRVQVCNFAQSCLGDRYGFLTIASLAVWTLFGGNIELSLDGTEICSGLVAQAVVRAGYIFKRDPSHMTPADLAEHFGVRRS
jgi:uncharacterized protein YycO